MNYEQIQTFLTVVSYGNITAAAGHLYVSQSTVSSRLQALEEEVGVPLLIRNKGQRAVELTNYGISFVPIASQWAALYIDTGRLKETANFHTLRIAAVDAVNSYTFTPLYNGHIKKNPDTKLYIGTHHSNEIHTLVENKSADIGFVFSEIAYPNLISKPVYRELMYVIAHKDSGFHDDMECGELDRSQEVFLRWGDDYEIWHNRHFNPNSFPLITVNTGSMLQHYLHEAGRWAIAPMSVIKAISYRTDLKHYTLKNSPPPRICYQVTNISPSITSVYAIREFEKELQDFIDHENAICRFEDWMIKDGTKVMK